MKLKSIFQKKIDRNIKGVIKVSQSDEANIKQELEEYVVTSELKEHIDSFFESYKGGITGSTDKNGIWISGFFGSGKSHFLKILSYVLKNSMVDGKNALSYFNNKGIKKSTIENMKEAEKISTDVILFNIASKAEDRSEKESILYVFNKVFNEMQGFCGNMPWIADLERQLLKDGVYDSFKVAFERISGKSWAEGRENFYYEKEAIVESLSCTTKMGEDTVASWYEKCEKNYSLSIDKFSERVKEYCEGKGNNHHVVFMVDEIGQYVGDNVQLMLNLQTLVEDLGTKCEGRCWVIVTAQGELTDFTKDSFNDFSKIQGRFNTKINLSSSNVDEVIKKRILRKNKRANELLRALYKENEASIKNLLVFSSEVGIKSYKDSEEFSQVYPFVPYQFSMFQRTLRGIRECGVVGKSFSKGERSLLEAYQQVAIEYMREDVGALIPFSAFYKTIENFLNPSIGEVIIEAKENKNLSTYDLQVLKVLFLIKYVEEVHCKLDTISTFLVSSIHESKKSIMEKTQEALNRLVKEGFVEKNGEEYSFLTKEEQLINEEIKKISIENYELNHKIGDIIFDDIYGEARFNYSHVYSFPFNKAVDDRNISLKNGEIGIKIITANYNFHGDRISELKRLSATEKNVVIDISGSITYLDEIENLLKLDNYLRIKSGVKSTEAVEKIIRKKSNERKQCLYRAIILIKEALKKSQVYAVGNLLDIGEKKANDKINEGLEVLINSEYYKLNYIKAFKNRVEELYEINDMEEDNPNNLAEVEVKIFIEGNNLRGFNTTVSCVVERFSEIPYGWNKVDIQGLIINLHKRGEIKAILNEKAIDLRDIVEYITNSQQGNRINLKVKEKIKSNLLDAVDYIANHLFNHSFLSRDADDIMGYFRELCNEEVAEIDEILANFEITNKYPGEVLLRSGKKLFEKILAVKDIKEFYEEVYHLEDELLDYGENIDPIKSFFFRRINGRIKRDEKGDQREIFDEALEVLKFHQDNVDFIEDKNIHTIIEEITSIVESQKPFNDIQMLPELLVQYNNKIKELVEAEEMILKAYIDKCKERVMAAFEVNNGQESIRSKVKDDFDRLSSRIKFYNSPMKLASLEKLVERRKDKWIKNISSANKIYNEITNK